MITKIAFLADCLYGDAGGGTERQFLKLCKALKKEDLDIHVFFLKSEPIHDEIDWSNPIETLDIHSLFRPSTISKVKLLIAQLDKKNIKIVQTFFDASALIGALIKVLRPDISVVGSLRNCGHAHDWLRKMWLGWSFRKHDKILVNASIIQRYMSENMAIDIANSKVIYNIIEATELPQLNHEDSQLYNKLKNHFKSTFTIVANLKPLKGIDDVISAVKQLNNPDIAFCFIGGGTLVDEYRQKITDLGLQQQCFILGPKDNVSAHLNCADAAIQASHSEGLSNSLIEYLFAGLPTIATDVGGSSEILENGKLGLLIPAFNPELLASAIASTAADLASLSKQAKLYSQPTADKYSADKIAKEYKDYYLEVLEN